MSNTRIEGRRQLARASGNLDTALEHVKNWLELGYADREDLAKMGLLITNSIIEVQKGVEKLRDGL